MSLVMWAVGFSALAGVTAALVASSFLVLPKRIQAYGVPLLVAFAVGVLLATAFLELLPHALKELGGAGMDAVGLWMVATLAVIFVIDKLLRWREAWAVAEERPAGALILVSASFHKFIDGLIIAAATLTDLALGVAAAAAILAHEIPHDLSKIAVLLDSGYRRLTTFLLNLGVSLVMIPGAVVGVWWLHLMEGARPYMLAVAAALFTYVALAALLPELQARTRIRDTAVQVLVIGLGGVIIFLIHQSFH